jgi:hypothetical protein
MNLRAVSGLWAVIHAGASSVLVAAGSVLRGLPLFLAARPGTPLRILCIMAFDMLHTLRNARPMPAHRRGALAALLDLGACANAAFDGKVSCRDEFRTAQRLLEGAGDRPPVAEYLRRLGDLERGRPSPGGGRRRFHDVALYREAVVRLSLGMVAATAEGGRCLDEWVRAIDRDADLNTLFRIVMLCQIIDDVLDHSKDASAGLPSLLTATASLPQAFKLTRSAALGYAGDRALTRAGGAFALRSALFLVSTCTKLVIVLGRWRLRNHPGRQFTGRGDGPLRPVATRPSQV